MANCKITYIGKEHCESFFWDEQDRAIELLLPMEERACFRRVLLPVWDGALCTLSTASEQFFINGENAHSETAPDGALVTVVKRSNGEKLNLICEYNVSVQMRKYDVNMLGGATICIGKREDCAIRYMHPMVSRQHVKLTFREDHTVQFEDVSSNGMVYWNGRLAKQGAMRAGDTLRVMGLTMLYANSFVALSASAGSLSCTLEPFSMPLSAYIGDRDQAEVPLFERSPRISQHREEHEVSVEMPPATQARKELPLMYMLGPSLTMGMGMMINLGSTIGRAMSGKLDAASLAGSLGMSVMMLGSSLIWPNVNRKYQKKKTEEDERYRTQRYMAYIQEKKSLLQSYVDRNRSVALDASPDPSDLVQRTVHVERRLWERIPSDRDFLNLRVGTASMPSGVQVNIPSQGFALDEDPLRAEPEKLRTAYEKASGMPVELPLGEIPIQGIVGDEESVLTALRCVITRIGANCAPDDVRMGFFLSPDAHAQLQSVKLLPHTWNEDRTIRYVAVTQGETAAVASALYDKLNMRVREGEDASHLPYYVIFVMGNKYLSQFPLMAALQSGGCAGLTSIFAVSDIGCLPRTCSNILYSSHGISTLYRKHNGQGSRQDYQQDMLDAAQFNAMSVAMSRIHTASVESAKAMPQNVTFMDMYRVGNLGELEAGRRWRSNKIWERNTGIQAAIGVQGDGRTFILNLSENRHGPHGLIAGTTGSGKSELLQTLILSLALNYRPELVSFILIDFKGGGMASSFEHLPHTSGVVTNLSGNAITRSLICIESEITRRQALFKKYEVNKIDAYQEKWEKGEIREAMPHLFIISDEFAELKDQQPEFMDGLVSAARTGRSLGIHLILATQKPAGVVNDQIWSNARFHICLKVGDREDSMEMLHRPDAATIQQPGRCYVQIGYNEEFHYVQSAYTGAQYCPSERFIDPRQEQVVLMDNAARPMYTASALPKPTPDAVTQLEAAVQYLEETGKNEGVSSYSIWLPPLARMISLDSLQPENPLAAFKENWKRTKKEWMTATVGMADIPSAQEQRVLKHSFSQGHLAVFGTQQTGKTTLLLTAVASLVAQWGPKDLSLCVLDFGSPALAELRRLPHCTSYVSLAEIDGVRSALRAIEEEIANRQHVMAATGGNIVAYRKVHPDKPMPALLIVADNLSRLAEATSPDELLPLRRIMDSGLPVGVYVILTWPTTARVPMWLTESVKYKLCLQINSVEDYKTYLGVRSLSLTPENTPGRGLCVMEKKSYEFQTALPVNEPDDAARGERISTLFAAMNEEDTQNPKQMASSNEKPAKTEPEETKVSLSALNEKKSETEADSGEPAFGEFPGAVRYAEHAEPGCVELEGTTDGRRVLLDLRGQSWLSIWGANRKVSVQLCRRIAEGYSPLPDEKVFYITEEPNAQLKNGITVIDAKKAASEIVALSAERSQKMAALMQSMASEDQQKALTESFERFTFMLPNIALMLDETQEKIAQTSLISAVQNANKLGLRFIFGIYKQLITKEQVRMAPLKRLHTDCPLVYSCVQPLAIQDFCKAAHALPDLVKKQSVSIKRPVLFDENGDWLMGRTEV